MKIIFDVKMFKKRKVLMEAIIVAAGKHAMHTFRK